MRRSHITYIIFGILVIAVMLRFSHLTTVPAWYTDEGMYAHNAWEFIHGNISTFGIADWTFVSPFSTTPPLYHAIAGILLVVFGKSIVVLRVFSACVGVATVWSLFWVGKYLFKNSWAGILPASFFAILPQFVVNSRWSFPQGLMGLLLLWAFFWMWRYRESNKLSHGIIGASFASFAAALSFWPWFFIVAVGVIAWSHGKKKTFFLMALALSLPLLVITIRALSVPSAFGKDLAAIFSGFFAANISTPQHDTLLGFLQILTRNILITISFVGMFFIRDRALRIVVLISVFAIALPVFLLRFDFQNYFYPALVFAPLFLLGSWGAVQLLQHFERKVQFPFSKVAGVMLCAYLVFVSAEVAFKIFRGTIAQEVSTHDFIFSDDVHLMKAVAQYLNPKLQPNDYVIAPNNLSWQLHARTSDKVWTACYEYQDQYSNLWPERFLYSQGVSDAAYIVEDTLFLDGDVSGCFDFHDEITKKISDLAWPIVFSNERFIVRQNPSNL